MTVVAERLAEMLNTVITESPIGVSIVYVVFFIIPYITSLIRKKV